MRIDFLFAVIYIYIYRHCHYVTMGNAVHVVNECNEMLILSGIVM